MFVHFNYKIKNKKIPNRLKGTLSKQNALFSTTFLNLSECSVFLFAQVFDAMKCPAIIIHNTKSQVRNLTLFLYQSFPKRLQQLSPTKLVSPNETSSYSRLSDNKMRDFLDLARHHHMRTL